MGVGELSLGVALGAVTAELSPSAGVRPARGIAGGGSGVWRVLAGGVGAGRVGGDREGGNAAVVHIEWSPWDMNAHTGLNSSMLGTANHACDMARGIAHTAGVGWLPGRGSPAAAGVATGGVPVVVVVPVAAPLATLLLLLAGGRGVAVRAAVGVGVGVGVATTGAGWVFGTTGPGVTLGVAGRIGGAGVAPGAGVTPGGGGAGTAAATAAVLTMTACACLLRHWLTEG